MKLFIWKRVNELTDRYHDNGGCAIVAESLESARELFRKAEPELNCGLLHKEPDFESEVSAAEPRLFIFPDAGCC
jgi:hypothetical protein